MWNAASPHGKFHKAAVQEPSSFYGAPKFFAHATGWVNDYSVGRAKANGASQSAGLATAGTAQTTMLAQEDLWNAASNDEITVENEGHLHPSEMNELQKLSPEYSKLPHISSQKDMDYHPMKWLKSEQESSSPHHVRLSKFKSTGTALSPKGIFEKLWNAAADDEIGGDPSADEPGHLEYKPRKWLRHQHDEAEMAEMHPRHGKRIFGGVQDHELNYDGAFVSDNSIGVHVSIYNFKLLTWTALLRVSDVSTKIYCD